MSKLFFKVTFGLVLAICSVGLTSCYEVCPSSAPYECSGQHYCCPTGYHYYAKGSSSCYQTKSDCQTYGGNCMYCD